MFQKNSKIRKCTHTFCVLPRRENSLYIFNFNTVANALLLKQSFLWIQMHTEADIERYRLHLRGWIG
jgi:hypothetical protein